MSHTPGPWKVSKLIPVNTVDNDYPGAEVSWLEVEEGHEGQTGHPHDGAVQIWSERAEANARLIAAAPDLLEALKGLRSTVWEGESVRKIAIQIANAAIAKAEGR